MDMQDELAAQCIANATELAQAGIRIAKVTKLEVDVPEEDIKRFDEMRQKVAEQMVGLQVDEIGIQRAALQAQAAAAAAQVNVQTAQYAAQANQFAINQQIQKDQAYVGMAGGDISKLGSFEAMRGAGAGMAHGGGNTGMAGLAAQVAVGAAVGGGLAGGMMPGRPGAPGVIAGVGVAANLVACPACNAQVPPGRFCAECGATLAAPAKKSCTNCGAELAANAKFCAECGTPSVAAQPPAQR
jgi:hypothetical protein